MRRVMHKKAQRQEEKAKVRQASKNKTTIDKDATSEEQITAWYYKVMPILSTATIVGVFLILVFFFTSGVTDNIVESRYASAAEQNGKTFASQTNSFKSKEETNEDESEKPTLDEMFITIMEEPSIEIMIRDTLESGGEVSKQDLMDRLASMDSAEFTDLIRLLLKEAPASENVTSDSIYGSLEEAYKEAERLYPGVVDATKRLRLIDDIVPADYLFYVAEEGDMLLDLSEAFGIPLGQLVELNGIKDADKIRAGEILLLPMETIQP